MEAIVAKVNVYGARIAVGVDVPQGSTQQYTTTTGVGYARMVWYIAWPLNEPQQTGSNAYEVTDVWFETDADGTQRGNLTVTSKGSDAFGSYGLYVFFTDAVPG
jgi:hypothetical protein